MRRAVIWLALAAGTAHAQPDADVPVASPPSAPPPPAGYGALPGGIHVPTAESLGAGVGQVELLGGYGYRKGLLAADHTLSRGIGQVAFAYAPTASLALAVSLDGRYDAHGGLGDDHHGYVGDPHLLVRFARSFGSVAAGAQVGVWVPGKDAPSIAPSAISVDLRALVSIAAGPGTLSLDAGFRLDNSASSVDHPENYDAEYQASFGVSAYHAVLAGAQYRIRTGSHAWIGLEGSADVFVGSGAPGPIIRGGVLAGVAVNPTFTVVGFLEGAKVPGVKYSDAMANLVPLIPYEPVVTGGLGLEAHFGGAAPATQIKHNEHPLAIEQAETADVTGTVVDDIGKPMVGAKVTVKLKNNTGTAVTDDKGGFSVAKLPIGKTVDGKTTLDDTVAEIDVEVANKKPGKATLTLAKGPNAVPKITLDPMLPPGQLRAVITNVSNSRPIAGATVKIEPGGLSVTSGPDGKFTIDLAPGQYKITVTAQGLAQQQLDVTIEQNGVAIKNIDMHK